MHTERVAALKAFHEESRAQRPEELPVDLAAELQIAGVDRVGRGRTLPTPPSTPLACRSSARPCQPAEAVDPELRDIILDVMWSVEVEPEVEKWIDSLHV